MWNNKNQDQPVYIEADSLTEPMDGSRGGGQGVQTPLVAIGFLKKYWYWLSPPPPPPPLPTWEAIGPKESNCFSREVRAALCEIGWWLKKWCQQPPWHNFLDPTMEPISPSIFLFGMDPVSIGIASCLNGWILAKHAQPHHGPWPYFQGHHFSWMDLIESNLHRYVTWRWKRTDQILVALTSFYWVTNENGMSATCLQNEWNDINQTPTLIYITERWKRTD